MSDLDPKAKASGSTPTVDGDAASATFWKKVIAFAINVKQGLDSLRGLNDPQDAAVTWRALAQLGLVTTNGSGKKVWKGGVIRHGNVTIGLPSGQADSTTPPIPLDFAASAAIATSILSWTEPDYSNHSYTEVWRNTSNSLTGATMIGTSTSSVYADNVGVTSGVRYYWIRHISTAGIIGPYQSSSGTANTTAQIAAADITPLCITNALISNTAAIDSAKIASLTADKITAGTITSQTITLGNNSSSIIKSSNYSAGSAGWQIRGDGVAEFQNVTVRGTLNASDISGGALNRLYSNYQRAFFSGYSGSVYSGSGPAVEDGSTTIWNITGSSASDPDLDIDYTSGEFTNNTGRTLTISFRGKLKVQNKSGSVTKSFIAYVGYSTSTESHSTVHDTEYVQAVLPVGYATYGIHTHWIFNEQLSIANGVSYKFYLTIINESVAGDSNIELNNFGIYFFYE